MSTMTRQEKKRLRKLKQDARDLLQFQLNMTALGAKVSMASDGKWSGKRTVLEAPSLGERARYLFGKLLGRMPDEPPGRLKEETYIVSPEYPKYVIMMWKYPELGEDTPITVEVPGGLFHQWITTTKEDRQ